MSARNSAASHIGALLVHGLGRTPCSMWPLARRLHHAGVDPHLFGYCAALSSFDTCVARLCARLRMLFPDPARPYVLIGHSLGSVMIRAALVHLEHLPLHVYLLAPPVTASLFARRVRNWLLFRLWAGSMGQQLADPVFMQAIPVLTVPATVYAGNAGIRTGWLPFGDRPNDGLLMLDETRLPGALWLEVRAAHTFIMRSAIVSQNMLESIQKLVV